MVSSNILTFVLAVIPSVYAACSSIEVRKEWRTLTSTEQEAWTTAVKCMANLPHNESLYSTVGTFAADIANITSNSSYYDDYAYVHSDLNTVIHFTGLFFPFHRYFVWSYTQTLKTSCNYTGMAPYWDWTIDSNDPLHSSIWSDDSTYGLGEATGSPSQDYEVTTGAFSNSSSFKLAYPVAHHLRRNLTIEPWLADNSSFFPMPTLEANATITPAKIDALIANFTGDFKSFQQGMEGFEGPHGGVHLMTGGDLGGNCPAGSNAGCLAVEPTPTFSANEPMFWLHHAMVDRVWWLWQNRDAANLNAFEGGSVENFTYYDEFPNGSAPWLNMSSVLPTDGILLRPGTTLGDVWSTEGDVLCYTYEE